MDDLFSRPRGGEPPRSPGDAPKPDALTVSQLNNRARSLLERQFAKVTVVGEISGYKIVSGHHYFQLKDDESQVACVLFRREAEAQGVRLKDGVEVFATGKLTIYGPYGRYQMVLERVEQRGAGALGLAFEELKRRLQAEGLFDAKKKRPLPLVPRRVVVVTSPTGAVIRDIVHVATRRFPKASILVVPARVQGADSAPSIVHALRKVAALAPRLGLDVCIVARGGGSLEDLWCFNDERVARAIAASPLPVVSGVGHETDFTIADFAADVRAPTPSAAAELVFPVHSDLLAMLATRIERSRRAVRQKLDGHRLRLRALKAELGDGRSLLRAQAQRLSLATGRSEDALRRSLARRRSVLADLERRLLRLHPSVHLRELKTAILANQRRLERAMRQRLSREHERLLGLDEAWRRAARYRLEQKRHELLRLSERVDALGPKKILERGYAIVTDEAGHVVRAASDVAVGAGLGVRLHSGSLGVTVTTRKLDS